MSFENQPESLVIPAGATSGRRIVIDGEAGTITEYNEDNQVILKIDETGLEVFDPVRQSSVKLQPTQSSALMLNTPPIPVPGTFLSNGGIAAYLGPGPDYRPVMDIFSPSVSFGGTPFAEIYLYGGGVQSTGSKMEFIANDIVFAGTLYKGRTLSDPTPEVWKPFPFENGWGNPGFGQPLRYKMLPTKDIHVCGNVRSPSVFTQRIGTMPLFYRPPNSVAIWSWTNQSPGQLIRFDPDGAVYAFGSVSTSIDFWINGIIPTE